MKQIKAKFEEIIDLRNNKMLELSKAEDLTHEMYDSIRELESENTPESGIILEMMYDKYADQYEKWNHFARSIAPSKKLKTILYKFF